DSAHGDKIMIKDIVVNLSIGTGRDFAPDYAISLAIAFDAYVSATSFAYDLSMPAFVGAGEEMPPEWIEEEIRKAEGQAKTAVAKVDDNARRAGISADSRMFSTTAAGAAETFGRLARGFDFSVIQQADPDNLVYEDLLLEAALFDSGRPVLVVPYAKSSVFRLERLMICWDGSRNAARAIADA